MTDRREWPGTITARDRPGAVSAGVELSVDAPAVEICVDVARLRQALDDLLDNALRHVPSGGRVRVTGVVDDGGINLTVEDSGGGFSAEVLSRAFERSRAGREQRRPERSGSVSRSCASSPRDMEASRREPPERRARVRMVVRARLTSASSSLHRPRRIAGAPRRKET
jgi:hypothetical protein